MRKELVCIQVIILLGQGIAFSQDTVEPGGTDLGFSLGVAEYQMRENALNNIRHRGTLASGGISYERIGEISRQKVEFYLIFSTLKSRYDPDKSSFAANPSLTYRYARKVRNINQELSLFLGGITGLDMHHEWFDNWDDSHLYWLTAYYLGIDGILTYRNSRDSELFLEIATPVVALISRPPERFLYKVANPKFSWVVDELHSNLRLTSVHEHFVFNINLGYTFRYSRRFTQRLYWRFSYTSNSVPYSKDLTILTHVFGAGFVF
jgi:hypothetical protein